MLPEKIKGKIYTKNSVTVYLFSFSVKLLNIFLFCGNLTVTDFV